MRSPRPPINVSPKLRERFERFTRKLDGGCWEWIGARQEKGYGHFGIDGRNYRAHRVAYELATGTPPGALLVCHSCDNPPCVNPAHLWLGTAQDNTQDMMAKRRDRNGGRDVCSRGHAYTPETTYFRRDRPHARVCRTCDHIRSRENYVRRKSA